MFLSRFAEYVNSTLYHRRFITKLKRAVAAADTLRAN